MSHLGPEDDPEFMRRLEIELEHDSDLPETLGVHLGIPIPVVAFILADEEYSIRTGRFTMWLLAATSVLAALLWTPWEWPRYAMASLTLVLALQALRQYRDIVSRRSRLTAVITTLPKPVLDALIKRGRKK